MLDGPVAGPLREEVRETEEQSEGKGQTPESPIQGLRSPKPPPQAAKQSALGTGAQVTRAKVV